MPVENCFRHQQYPTEPVIAPVLQTLNVGEARETDFSRLHTALKIGRVVLVHGTFMGDDPLGIAETLKSVAQSVPWLAEQLNLLAVASLEKTRPFTCLLYTSPSPRD